MNLPTSGHWHVGVLGQPRTTGPVCVDDLTAATTLLRDEITRTIDAVSGDPLDIDVADILPHSDVATGVSVRAAGHTHWAEPIPGPAAHCHLATGEVPAMRGEIWD